jgi:hypothetical protein
MHRARLVTVAVLAVAVAGIGWAPQASAETVSTSLRTAVSGLPVAAEVRTGYQRSLFPLWIDSDGDGCNTRFEVLIAEATTRPSVGSGCTLSGGRWLSYYDNAVWTDPADLDIDHLVPLAEAWDSGARDLVAVTDNVNQAKGDRDPAEWMPSYAPVRCRYLAEWVVVKLRWRLTVDSAERSALSSLAAGCANVTITVTLAI